MSRVANSSPANDDFDGVVSHLFDFPETIGKLMFPSRSHRESYQSERTGNIPVDILDTPKEFIMYMDLPGLSKSDIQVTIEEEKTLVVKSNGKRKREEEEECKYLRLERKPLRNLMRKLRLPENCNVSAITAKCENGVLTVAVEKLPPPPKPKSVKVTIS